MAPASTPRPIVDKLNAALRTAVTSASFQDKISADGVEPVSSTPEEYAADIDHEETKWSALVKQGKAEQP